MSDKYIPVNYLAQTPDMLPHVVWIFMFPQGACRDSLTQRSYANEENSRYVTRKYWRQFLADEYFGILWIYVYINEHIWLTLYCARVAQNLYMLIFYAGDGQGALEETYERLKK